MCQGLVRKEEIIALSVNKVFFLVVLFTVAKS